MDSDADRDGLPSAADLDQPPETPKTHLSGFFRDIGIPLPDDVVEECHDQGLDTAFLKQGPKSLDSPHMRQLKIGMVPRMKLGEYLAKQRESNGQGAAVPVAKKKAAAKEKAPMDPVKQANAAVDKLLPAWISKHRKSDQGWEQWSTSEGMMEKIDSKVLELTNAYGEALKQTGNAGRKYFKGRMKTYVHNQRRGKGHSTLKGAGYHLSKSDAVDLQQQQLREAVKQAQAAKDCAYRTASSAAMLVCTKVAAVRGADTEDQEAVSAAEADLATVLASQQQADAAHTAAVANLSAAQQALDDYKPPAAQALAAAGQTLSKDGIAAGNDATGGAPPQAGRNAVPPAAAASKRKRKGGAGSMPPLQRGRRRAGVTVTVDSASDDLDEGEEVISDGNPDSTDPGLSSQAQRLLEVTHLNTLQSKYSSVPKYGSYESHSAYLASVVSPKAAAGEKVVIPKSQTVMVMGCSGANGDAQVLAMANPIYNLILQDTRQKPSATCSLQIIAVKPGVSMQGLVHCFGEAVNTKFKNILSCGASVDGWPVSGVLLSEPRTGHSCKEVLAGWGQMVTNRR